MLLSAGEQLQEHAVMSSSEQAHLRDGVGQASVERFLARARLVGTGEKALPDRP
jgi:hypothetical protein